MQTEKTSNTDTFHTVGIIIQTNSVNSLNRLLQPDPSGIYELELMLLINYKFIFDSKLGLEIAIRKLRLTFKNCEKRVT